MAEFPSGVLEFCCFFGKLLEAAEVRFLVEKILGRLLKWICSSKELQTEQGCLKHPPRKWCGWFISLFCKDVLPFLCHLLMSAETAESKTKWKARHVFSGMEMEQHLGRRVSIWGDRIKIFSSTDMKIYSQAGRTIHIDLFSNRHWDIFNTVLFSFHERMFSHDRPDARTLDQYKAALLISFRHWPWREQASRANVLKLSWLGRAVLLIGSGVLTPGGWRVWETGRDGQESGGGESVVVTSVGHSTTWPSLKPPFFFPFPPSCLIFILLGICGQSEALLKVNLKSVPNNSG